MSSSHTSIVILEAEIDSIHQSLLTWWQENNADFPWRRFIPIWQAIVAEIMLQRTKAEQVVPVFREFQRRYQSAAQFSEATRQELKELMRPLGLGWRTDGVYELARAAALNSGRFPSDVASLQKLKGVGPYVAAAVSSLHAGHRAVIIDSNVVRVLCRLIGSNYGPETRRKAWLKDLADKLTPEDARSYNYALLDLAMKVCVPRTPACEMCPLIKSCVTGRTTTSIDPVTEMA